KVITFDDRPVELVDEAKFVDDTDQLRRVAEPPDAVLEAAVDAMDELVVGKIGRAGSATELREGTAAGAVEELLVAMCGHAAATEELCDVRVGLRVVVNHEVVDADGVVVVHAQVGGPGEPGLSQVPGKVGGAAKHRTDMGG